MPSLPLYKLPQLSRLPLHQLQQQLQERKKCLPSSSNPNCWCSLCKNIYGGATKRDCRGKGLRSATRPKKRSWEGQDGEPRHPGGHKLIDLNIIPEIERQHFVKMAMGCLCHAHGLGSTMC